MSCDLLTLFFVLLALVIALAMVAEWIPTNAGTITVAALALIGAAVPRFHQNR